MNDKERAYFCITWTRGDGVVKHFHWPKSDKVNCEETENEG